MTQTVASPRQPQGGMEEQSAGGLIIHRGPLNAGLLRAMGAPNFTSDPNWPKGPPMYPRAEYGSGSSLELIHAPHQWSVVQSYDRDTSQYLDLVLYGKNIGFYPQGGGRVVMPQGTVHTLLGEYLANPNWAAPQASTWLETPVQVTANWLGTASAIYRVEFTAIISSTVATSFYMGLGVDGTLVSPSIALNSMYGNDYRSVTSYVYWRPGYGDMPGGTHRTALFLYTTNMGVQFNPNASTHLTVTEIRA